MQTPSKDREAQRRTGMNRMPTWLERQLFKACVRIQAGEVPSIQAHPECFHESGVVQIKCAGCGFEFTGVSHAKRYCTACLREHRRKSCRRWWGEHHAATV